MADLYYIREKFGVAVHHMAVTDGSLRDRVHDAYVSSARLALGVSGGHADAQPSAELTARLEALHERVTNDGTYDLSFKAMSDDEVAAVAEEIYEINDHAESEIEELVRKRHQAG